jgi:hypothetical protein
MNDSDSTAEPSAARPILTTATAPRTLPFRGFLPAPFDKVRFRVEGFHWGFVIEYRGPRDDMVRSRAVTRQLIAPSQGKQRLDRDGDRVQIRCDKRAGYLTVARHKSGNGPWCHRLPGFEQWMIDARDAAHAAEQKRQSVAAAAKYEVAPDDWHRDNLQTLALFFAELERRTTFALAGGYRLNQTGLGAYRSHLHQSRTELAALLRQVRIEPSALRMGIRMVVDNTAS